MSSTICALATPAGGAIGIIRISGPEAFSVMENMLRSRKGATFHYTPERKRFYGDLYSANGNLLDDVVVNFFKSPHSYTGEDCVEISCHGSSYILQQVLTALIKCGCRQAEPGEYTKRAYLNGRMDLSQAEAVADLVSASNRASHRLALGQLRGSVSNSLSRLRERLLKLKSLLELELDFSDHEELEFANRDELLSLAEELRNNIQHLAASFETGKAIKNGIAVAIVGKPNVGKSTLLNRLLKEDRAIVSEISGTTRDVIEDTTQIHGLTFRFIDTAGLRSTNDEIEKMGIERTYQKLSQATIVIWLIDKEPSAEEAEEMSVRTAGKRCLKVYNKIDLINDVQTKPSSKSDEIFISAKYGTNVDELEEQLYHAAAIPEITENDVIVTNARHYDALLHAQSAIEDVITGLHNGLSADLLSEDLKICLEYLSEITGDAITPKEVLNNIFSHFCIGK